MKVELNSEVRGFPCRMVRKFVREFSRGSLYSFSLAYVMRRLKIPEDEAFKFVEALTAEGLIERVDDQDDREAWAPTVKGNSFAIASTGKPITRAQADQLINELIDRVKEINEDSDYAYVVSEVRVFGSYLTQTPTLNDVDVHIKFSARWTDENEFKALRDASIRRAEVKGRQFRGFFEELAWPEVEVWQYLKAGKRKLSLHSDDLIINCCESKVVYELVSDGTGTSSSR
jgi:hypothetical protein